VRGQVKLSSAGKLETGIRAGQDIWCEAKEKAMTFREALSIQRWDDHRYYHHSRINQSLHLVSAISFLCAYVLVFIEPAAAALVGWLIAMPSRQIGHFLFEPKGYDEANQATHEYKEHVKVGYNLRRKTVLLSVWACSPLLLLLDPTALGWLTAAADPGTYLHNVAVVWLVIGLAAILFRTVQLFFLKDVQAGLVWFTKILTDPVHDIVLYHKAPAMVLRGELFDPIVEQKTA
jgi:hypothetical protein